MMLHSPDFSWCLTDTSPIFKVSFPSSHLIYAPYTSTCDESICEILSLFKSGEITRIFTLPISDKHSLSYSSFELRPEDAKGAY